MDTTKSADRLLATAAAEEKVAEVAQLGDDLLAQIEGSDAATATLLRAEARRLFSIAFEITIALAHDDIGKAFRLSIGADVGGALLGVAI